MYNYKMTVTYDGSNFRGWQKQGNTDNTIQGKLESIAGSLAESLGGGGEAVDVNGAGRTDAGVHAVGQIANFKLRKFAEPSYIKDFFNKYLPEAIRVVAVEKADERFHARLSAVKKTYRYNVFVGEEMNVFLRKYAYFWDLKEKSFDVGAVRQAAERLVGVHDFSGFCTKVPKNKSAVREIYSVNISESDLVKGLVTVDFCGNGFLYNQVRIMVGTLLEIGEGKRTAESIEDIFKSNDRAMAGFTAPPQGLTLVSVEY